VTCIKTGAVAYLDEYGEWVYGDAHVYCGVLVFRSVYRTRDIEDLAQFGNVRHFTILRLTDWWDERKTSMPQNSTLIAEPFLWCQDGDYEGIREPRLPVSETSEPAAAPAPPAPAAE
jgi:hypothetical protein